MLLFVQYWLSKLNNIKVLVIWTFYWIRIFFQGGLNQLCSGILHWSPSCQALASKTRSWHLICGSHWSHWRWIQCGTCRQWTWCIQVKSVVNIFFYELVKLLPLRYSVACSHLKQWEFCLLLKRFSSLFINFFYIVIV